VADESANQPRRRLSARRIVAYAISFLVGLAILWPAQFGGVFGMTLVNGTSMQPGYHKGDLVVSIRQPSYSKNDVVSFTVPASQSGAGARVIHRILSVDKSSGSEIFTSKGDHNPVADPWTFTDGDVMGRALFSVPAIGPALQSIGNPIALSLTSGLLATLLLWRFGSAGRGRSRRGSPQNHG
jgi:signal peptidase